MTELCIHVFVAKKEAAMPKEHSGEKHPGKAIEVPANVIESFIMPDDGQIRAVIGIDIPLGKLHILDELL